jgi:cysteinyl-tRNA synthetase
VLWKPSKPGEPAWPSPAGIKTPGRPGWHIECSAMSWKWLGETFDIHGGGIDLMFPHHENEIAQSRCAFHTPIMAQFWMHNGFLQVEGEKMAKSAGNFVTIRELLTGWGDLPWAGDAIRLAMIMTAYSQPLDWTEEKLLIAAGSLHRFRAAGMQGMGLKHDADISSIPEIVEGRPSDQLLEHLMDDLNTPAAITHLYALAKKSDHVGDMRADFAKQLLIDCFFLGLDPFRYVREQGDANSSYKKIDEQQVEQLIAARSAARKAKNWTEADRIRDELLTMGIGIEDNKDGTTTWEIVPPRKASKKAS